MSWCTLDHIGTWDKTRWTFDTHCYIHIYAPGNLGRTKRGFSAVSTMLGTDQLIMLYVLESMNSLHLFTSSSCSAHYDCIWLHYICVVKDSAHHLMPSFGSIWFKIIQNLPARSCSICNGFDVWELEPLCSVRSARKLNMHELGSRKSANNISYMFLIVLACFGQI